MLTGCSGDNSLTPQMPVGASSHVPSNNIYVGESSVSSDVSNAADKMMENSPSRLDAQTIKEASSSQSFGTRSSPQKFPQNEDMLKPTDSTAHFTSKDTTPGHVADTNKLNQNSQQKFPPKAQKTKASIESFTSVKTSPHRKIIDKATPISIEPLNSTMPIAVANALGRQLSIQAPIYAVLITPNSSNNIRYRMKGSFSIDGSSHTIIYIWDLHTSEGRFLTRFSGHQSILTGTSLAALEEVTIAQIAKDTLKRLSTWLSKQNSTLGE